MAAEVPKAILYSWHTSVWGTVPLLCLHEKGYSEDEYVTRQVDITKGENFSPAYLKINMNGTVPTLVVPMLETTTSDVDSRYRSLRDTITICDFLDSARNPNTHNTTSHRPAPTLAPATIEGKATSDRLIALCHEPSVDPNFLAMACRSKEELRERAKGTQGTIVRQRRAALEKYIKEAETIAQEASGGGSSTNGKALTYEQKVVAFLEEKYSSNQIVYEVYSENVGPEEEKAFFDASSRGWTQALPEVLGKIENIIKGPFALGDQVCLADLHMIAWLARLIGIAGGKLEPNDYEKLEAAINGKIGEKLRTFWKTWLERESFKKTISTWPDLVSDLPASEVNIL